MSKSRYADTPIIDDHHYGTFALPVFSRGYVDLNLLQNVKTTNYTYLVGDRLDKLAARFYNDESYWWVIAISNNIAYPFASGGLVPGRLLKIPVNPQDIFDQILR